MIFTLFTAIVFVSQVIIAFTIIFHLIKMDKEIKYWNNFLTEAKPKIKDIMVLAREISVQRAHFGSGFHRADVDVLGQPDHAGVARDGRIRAEHAPDLPTPDCLIDGRHHE